MRARLWLGGVLLAAGLAGCASAPPIRYYAVPAIAPASPAVGGGAGSRIDLRAVIVPPSLDREEIVREDGAGAYVVRDADHWAAPLAQLSRQALLEDLALRLSPSRLVFAGGRPETPVTALTVEILSFSVAQGRAVMTLNWVARGPAGAVDRFLTLDTPANDTAPEVARAWSVLLARLADNISATVP